MIEYEELWNELKDIIKDEIAQYCEGDDELVAGMIRGMRFSLENMERLEGINYVRI